MSLLTKAERKRQERLAAQLMAERNARKSKNVIQAGNLPSQWGKVVSNEQRLIDNGHFMKTGEGANLDYYREQYRKVKKASGDRFSHTLVKKDGGIVDKYYANNSRATAKIAGQREGID